MDKQNSRRWLTTAGVGVAGLIAGGVLAGTLAAQAADSGSTATPQGPGAPTGNRDQSRPQRSDEHLLTGDTAAQVRAAALAKYPGATVVRVETDSDGVYEAHLTKADGTPVTVEVDKSFAVTGEEAGGPGGPGGHGRGPGDHDGDHGMGPGGMGPGGMGQSQSGSSASGYGV